jgi:hypothetical protein
MSNSIPVHTSKHRAPPPRAASSLDRHDLHRAVDGDWPSEPLTPADLRMALVVGLAVVAALPITAMLLGRWPDAPRELTSAIASLPLLALVLAAIAWRPAGRAKSTHPHDDSRCDR